jgi:hypothetical protein
VSPRVTWITLAPGSWGGSSSSSPMSMTARLTGVGGWRVRANRAHRLRSWACVLTVRLPGGPLTRLPIPRQAASRVPQVYLLQRRAAPAQGARWWLTSQCGRHIRAQHGALASLSLGRGQHGLPMLARAGAGHKGQYLHGEAASMEAVKSMQRVCYTAWSRLCTL